MNTTSIDTAVAIITEKIGNLESKLDEYIKRADKRIEELEKCQEEQGKELVRLQQGQTTIAVLYGVFTTIVGGIATFLTGFYKK